MPFPNPFNLLLVTVLDHRITEGIINPYKVCYQIVRTSLWFQNRFLFSKEILKIPRVHSVIVSSNYFTNAVKYRTPDCRALICKEQAL